MPARVVITGLGVVSPNASGIRSFKTALEEGKSGIRYIEELERYNFTCHYGGVPEKINEEQQSILDKYSLDEADDSIKYAVLAGLEAWTDAGFTIPDFFENNTLDDAGCIIGTSLGGTEIFIRKMYPVITMGNVRRLGSQIVEHWMPSGPAASLSKILALGNQTTANSSACSTGLESIIMSADRIRNGKAQFMLAGGTDPYTPYCWAGFDAMRLLCRNKYTDPAKASRPLSVTASGFVPSAGAGVVLLENLEHAVKRNARIYSEIAGSEINSGGHRNGGSMTYPNPVKVIECIKSALFNANINPQKIDFVSGHLTGTKADVLEILNWKKALSFGNNMPFINAPKSMIGHTIGAAGAIELIAAILQLTYNFVHPSINSEDLHPEIQQMVDREKIPLSVVKNVSLNYIAKASFGFGDVNSCIILKKYV
ncbi:MAG TPA: beta-ketoacyl-[acyl-carrier-protein] synthase family protein [Bacteroidales bacterium]|nr:beta-ketoacyl-[acyl-carrier-protein] synthase family protein [Bacteroidales bacterium]